MKLELFNCRLCGGELELETGETYRCKHCGKVFFKNTEDEYISALESVMDKTKQERVAAARRNLWREMHNDFTDSIACVSYARELKNLIPEDYYANFAETVNGKSDREISDFLNESSEGDMNICADVVIEFMINSLTPKTLKAVSAYIDRAYPDKTSKEYTEFTKKYEAEAEKVKSFDYNLDRHRDVFFAYSSKDSEEVKKLCEYLESQKITCFFSERNLQHGKGAENNYDIALKKAMDNCLVVVFVSSINSRDGMCDALMVELPYMRNKDVEKLPSKYVNTPYARIPSEFKKDRVEYLLDERTGIPAEGILEDIFYGFEWCKTPDELARRILKIKAGIQALGSSHIKEKENSGTSRVTPEEIESEESSVHKDVEIIVDAEEGESEAYPEPEEVETALPIKTKEKNILKNVSRLLEAGNFDKALKYLDDFEHEMADTDWNFSAGVCYYRILAKNLAKEPDEIVNAVISNRYSLTDDEDYRLAMSCDDDEYKKKINDIKAGIDEAFAKIEKEKKEEEERENERQEQERLDAAAKAIKDRERQEQTRKEAAERNRIYEEDRRKKKEDEAREIARSYLTNMAYIMVPLVLYLVASLIVGLLVKSAAGGAMFVLGVIVVTTLGIVLLCVFAVPIKNKTAIALAVVTIALGLASVVPAVIFLPGGNWRKTTIDGVQYDVNYSFCRVLGIDDASGDLVIPSEIDGKPVTIITKKAFSDCINITSVTIPDSVRKIRSSAFEGCAHIETVVTSGNGIIIRKDAFRSCRSLENINLTGVEKIGKRAFRECSSLEDVTLADGLKTIRKRSFFECTSIREITIPSSVKKIGKRAFFNCKLSYVYFEDTTGWRIPGEKLDPDRVADSSGMAKELNKRKSVMRHK